MTKPRKPLNPTHVTGEDAEKHGIGNPGDPGVVVPPPGSLEPTPPDPDLPPGVGPDDPNQKMLD